jgi:hypothetical protein
MQVESDRRGQSKQLAQRRTCRHLKNAPKLLQ